MRWTGLRFLPVEAFVFFVDANWAEQNNPPPWDKQLLNHVDNQTLSHRVTEGKAKNGTWRCVKNLKKLLIVGWHGKDTLGIPDI